MVIAERHVKHSKSLRHCVACHYVIEAGDSYVDIYGMAFRGDPPYHIANCIECYKEYKGLSEYLH